MYFGRAEGERSQETSVLSAELRSEQRFVGERNNIRYNPSNRHGVVVKLGVPLHFTECFQRMITVRRATWARNKLKGHRKVSFDADCCHWSQYGDTAGKLVLALFSALF